MENAEHLNGLPIPHCINTVIKKLFGLPPCVLIILIVHCCATSPSTRLEVLWLALLVLSVKSFINYEILIITYNSFNGLSSQFMNNLLVLSSHFGMQWFEQVSKEIKKQ